MQEYAIDLRNLSLEKRDELGERLFEMGETPFENHLYNDDGPHTGRVYGDSNTVSHLQSEGWQVSLAWKNEIG